MLRRLIILGLITTLAACATEHSCQSNSAVAMVLLDGFDSATLEQVMVTYKGRPYSDSTIYLLSASGKPLKHNDTNSNLIYFPFDIRINSGDDIEVLVASTGKKYHISGLTRTNGTVKQSFMGNDEECWDVITGYTLDGTYHTTGLNKPSFSGGSDKAYILLRP